MSSRRAYACLLFAVVLLLLWKPIAAQDPGYMQRRVVTTHGAITFVGNSLGLNKDSTLDAPGASGSIGTFTTTDTNLRDNPQWPPGTTDDWRLNNSSAVVSVQAGSRVIHAELIWGGSYLFGTEDVSDFLNDPITFTTPAGTTQVTRDPATAVERSGAQQNYYVRTADVTALVSAAGNGTYTVGRVPATQSGSEANFNAAGWTLAILYENANLPTRSLSLFLGLEPQGGATASVTGICTADKKGQLRARVAVSAVEGDTNDPNDTRDSLRFGPSIDLSPDQFRLSGPNNPAANFFASQINRDDGELDTRGTFGDRNNDFLGIFIAGRQGWDITNVDASAQLVVSQTTAFAQGTAEFDDFFVNALAMQIDVVAPVFDAERATTVSSSTAQVGDVLTYTVEMDNKGGPTGADNVVLAVPLPAGMSFVAGSFTLDGVADPGANPITGATIGTVAPKASREATFQLRVDTIPVAPASARYQVTPTWTYTFVGCVGQTPQSASSTSNTVTTEIARITAAKSASASSIRPDETLTYTIATLNSGTAASHDTLVTDAIPTGTTYRPNTTTLNGVAVADQLGTSPLVVGMLVNSAAVAFKPSEPGVIGPGQSAVVSFQVVVNSATTGPVVNTASIEPDGLDGPLPAFTASVLTPVNRSPADVEVSLAGPVTATAGTDIIHTITVRNNGPATATAVSLVDAVPPGLTQVSVTGACTSLPCSLGTMANGDTRTVSVTYAIPLIYSGPDPIVNRASVTAAEDIFPNNNLTSVSTALRASVADLAITNTNDVSSVVAGVTTTYTITVTNAGPATAADAVVTDTFPPSFTGVSWSCVGTGGAVCGAATGTGNINATVTIPVTGAATFTATGTADPAFGDTIENTARVVPAEGTSDPTPAIATDIDPIELRADLSVTMTGLANVVAGAHITYTLTVHNAGASAAAAVLLEELVPVELTFVSTTGPCSTFPCNLGTLPVGATVSTQVTYAVPTSYLAGTVDSAAHVSSSTLDPNLGNNTGTTTATIDRDAEVEIIKEISPDTTSLLGEDATFFVTVTNHGPAPATAVVVKDLLPAGLSLVSAHVSQGSYLPQLGLWFVGRLEDDAFATLTLISTLDVVDSITNMAQILFQIEPDPITSNNVSAAIINGQANADVGVNVAVDKPAPLVGENVTFTVAVQNRGPSPATGLVVADLLSAGLTLVSATPSQGTWAAPNWTIGDLSEIAAPVTLTVVATVTAPGANVNGAIITQQTEGDANPVNNRASVTINAAESANLKVTKTLTRSSPQVGELLTFNVLVTNQGPIAATGVQVTEMLSAGLEFDSAVPSQGAYDEVTGLWTVGSIANAGSAGLTLTARVTQAGTISNTASISGSDQPDPDLTDNTSTVTLTTATNADLAITKTLTGAAVPGLATSYTIVVTNLGPSPVTGASVDDVFPLALVTPAWTCAADAGSSCAAASGSGSLATTVTLEAGDRATFLVTGLIASGATGLLQNTATVTAPATTVDGVIANNTATSSVLLAPSAALQITKAGPSTAVAGTNLVYTIIVTNAGPSDATAVTLADPAPTGLIFVSNAGACTTAFPCALGTLAPGATSTVTATFAIPSGYTAPNPIANTATVSSSTPPAVSASATTNTPVAEPVTDLHITKTNGVDGVIAGLPTTYTITVTNPLGPSDASGATVTDTFPPVLTGVTWTCTATGGGVCPVSGSGDINTSVSVPVGATVVFLATGTVSAAATGDLINSASVAPPTGLVNRTSAVATDHDAIATEADVAITKTGPASIVAGNNLIYTITVTNAGPSNAAGVMVSDATPAGLVFVSNTGDCITAFPCALGSVPVGVTRTITATFTVPPDYSGPSPIANVAVASATTLDPVTTNNTATAETTLDRNADVAITKTVAPASVLVGQPTTFTVVVTNHGPARVTGLVVQDLLPAGLSFVSAAPSHGSYAESTGAWTIGTLLNAQAATLTLEATVTLAGAITNRALVVGQDQPDPVASNNSAAAIVNGAANADVGVTKTADRPAPLVGETVTFTVTAANSGPSPATGVIVTDALPAGLTFVNAVPSQGTYTAPTWTVGTLSETGTPATLTIIATVTAPGALVNTATITQQTELDPNAANNSASVTLNAAESANLKVTKALTRSTPHVGELLTFNVVVANQGPSPATGVQVTEVLSAGLDFESAVPSHGAYDSVTGLWTVGSIANAGSAGLTITARVTQAGTVTNTASVTGDQPDPDLADNSATVTVTTETIADLAITKTLTGSTIPGVATTYTIVVTNLGPSPVTAASVTDVFPVALVAPAWTCVADPGSSCAAPSGTGNLATTVTLEAGDRATFLVTGVIASNATGSLANTATVAVPTGATDPVAVNNTATSTAPLTPSADVQITKRGPPTAVAGTNIAYTITVTNAGPSDAAAVTLTDPTPPGLTFLSNAGDCTTAFPCALGIVPAGATRTITATFAIPSGYSTPNPIVNTATVSSTTPPAVSASATTNTPVAEPVTDLHITKTNGVDGVIAGRPTTYTITITNPLGPSDASGATVTDTFPAALTGVTWTCVGTGGGVCPASGSGDINATVTVPVGATVVFSATGTVNPAATGDLINSAAVVPPAGLVNRTSAVATDHDAIDTEADVAITKTGPASIVAGNNLIYTITVTNAGPSNAAGVIVSDATPAGLVFVSNAGDCTTAFPCALGIVPVGVTRTITATFTVPADYSGPSPIANVAVASATTLDPATPNDTATAQTTLNRNADVAITKTVSPASVLVGQPATFTVVVTNHGPARVTGLVVQDLLPAGLSFVSATPSLGSYDEATGRWTIGTLLNAQSETLTLEATVTLAGAITNRALVVGQDQPDPVASNNSAAAIVNGAANADVGVTKTADRPAPLVGETVTFMVTVANAGPSPATGVIVTDAVPAGLTFVNAVPSQGTYTAPTWTVGTLSETGTPATLTIVATVTAPGALVNTATITQQTELDPNAANNSASVTLNAAESANLKVTKGLTRSAPHVGELLTFNVMVTNQGPSPATGVAVAEVLSAGLAFELAAPSQGSYDSATGLWTVGSIANGGSAGLTITARVTQAGTVTNTASVSASDQPDPNPADNSATVTVTTETIADLAVTKALTGPAIPGLATTYTIVVTNLGPSPVSGAGVSDVFPLALAAPGWTCSADPGSSCAAPSGTGNIATTVTLEAGDRATFLVTGVIASNASGSLVNTATVAVPAGATDPVPANNTATSTVTLTPSADVQVTKSGPGTAVAGTNVVYTITVANAGPSDAAAVTVADVTPTGLTFVSNAGDCTTAFPCALGTLATAATRTITATFAIPPGYLTPDPIENTATVSSPTPDAATGNNSATATTALAAAVTDLHITKTNGVNGVVAGQPTTYTITITNPLGPSNATGATVIDTFPTALTGVTWTCVGTSGGVCPAPGSGDINTTVTVPVGATVAFSATGTVNPSATGVLVNSAQVLPPAGLANRTSAIATDSDPITVRADLGITKTGPTSIVAGNNLIYTITVTNAGPSDAVGVTVGDATPAGLVFVSNTGDCVTAFPCALDVVPTGATRTITATFALPLTYAGVGPIANVATVSSSTLDDSTANNTATAETTLNRNADVAISKTVAPASVLVGQPTTFTVVVTNHGPARATGLVVQDLLPAGLSFVSASASLGSYDETSGAWTIGTLLNAQSATLTLEATVTVAGAITNRALVVGQDQPDPVASNNSAAAIVNGAANADVGVTKAADRPAPLVGEDVTFTVTVANAGPSPATGVVVTDALPAGLALVSATASQGVYVASDWTVGTLSETGTPATLTIVATVTASGALVNTATITQQTELDPNAANNSASVTLNAAESANLRVTKALTRTLPHVGELLTFNVIVANQGPSPATGVAITEALSAGLAFESAAASQGTYDSATGLWAVGALGNGGSAGLTITARVTQAGTVTNTASVSASDQPDPDLLDNSATVTLTTATIADLAITKTLTGGTVPGRVTTYTIVVTNLGPSPVTAASVTDPFPVALVSPVWTCSADPGSSCAAPVGTGDIATTVTLEAGDRATFLVAGLIASNATGSLSNTATVAVPAGATDPVPGNNSANSTVTLTPSADVLITKSGPTTAVAGTNVVYTITVTNAGPSDAAAVTVADVTPAGLTFVSNAGDCTTAFPCNLGTLPRFATRTITATFSIPSAYTAPNPIVNTATVSSTTPDAAADNNSATTNTPVGTPLTDLRITKTNGVNGVVAGLSTTYTITITNPLGPSDATGATVADTFPAALTGSTWTCTATGGGVCPASGSGDINTPVNVPVGATVVFSASGTVSAAATGVLVNSAAVTPPTGYVNRASAIATDSDAISARADLGITKTGPTSIVAGNNLIYTITVTNAGPSDAAGVIVSDPTPGGLTWVSNTDNCTTAFPCALGVVPAGATRTITATFGLPNTYPGLGPIVNVASVSSTTFDDTAANNTATFETTLTRDADVAITKAVAPASVLVGQPTTFTLVVTNHGPARATGVVVQDLLPAGLSFVSATASLGSYDDATGRWTIGTLLNAQSATLTLEATVTMAGAITNRALVVGRDQPDLVASNNSAAAIVNGAANADVGVTKIVDQPAPLVGETVTFTVTATNRGPSPATSVVVSDALPAGLTLVSATASQGSYVAPDWAVGTLSETGSAATATLTIVATVAAPGALVNTAAITQQMELDPNAANNSASVTLNAAASANLKVTKALTRSSPHVGELLTFNVMVANQGPSPATGVAITEVLSAGLDFESAAASQGTYDAGTGLWTVGAIANGDSAGLTITARVTQAGTVTNTASVSDSDQLDPDPADNSATVTVTTETIADLAITKTHTGSTVPGRVTTYSIVVTNLGPSPVTAASVTDPFPVALVAPVWTCSADPGSSCAAASGSGNLATTVTLEAGDRATFLVTGLIASNATGSLVNTATVTVPAGASDPVPANNAATSTVILTPSADVLITKTGPATAVAGTNITYTITVTNAGPSDATTVAVADLTPAGLTFVSNAGDCTTGFPCSFATLPRFATRIIVATFAIPSAYTAPNPIVNTATVSSTTPDAAAANNSATTNTPVGTPLTDLRITKTNGVNGVVAGLSTTYTITITNPLGPSDATGATVTDTFPAAMTGATWTCTATGGGACVASGSGDINTSVSVPVGATLVFSATGTVNPSATGVLVNSAQVLPPAGLANRTSAIATDSDAITTRADLGITKTGLTSIVAGNNLIYTITVTNAGPSDAAGVVVSDTTPAGLEFVSNTGGCTTTFPCALGTLPAGATRTITATFTVPTDYGGPSPIANITRVSATTVDPNTTNNSATAETTLNRDADVEVTKTVASPGVLVGDEVTITITAINRGPNPATGIEITESLPAGFDFVFASASQGTYDQETGAWAVGSLADGENAQLILTATVTAPGVITNLAVKTGQNEPDPIVGNDSAAARTTATPAADLEVDKEVDRHDALVGEMLTFTVRATNRGPSPATGVTIADTLPAGLSFVSALPSQGSYDTATGIWTVGSLDSPAQVTLTLVATVDQTGALTNNATVASQDQIDPNPLNNSAAVSVNAAPAADLRVAKAVSNPAPGVGALVTYTVAVTNLGPNDATTAEVSDVLPAGIEFVSARASQGGYDAGTGVWTLGAMPVTTTEILRLTGRVMAPGTVVNTATRQSSTPVDPNPANDTGTATLTSSVVADLSLTKTPSVPAAAAGTAFTWTIAVVNNGPSAATGATVIDSFPGPYTGVTWTCNPTSGSSCASPSGTGPIASTVNLLAGGSATFVATGLSAPTSSAPLENVATVTPAGGTTDLDPSNNTDTSRVGLASLADAQVTMAGPSVQPPGAAADYLITIVNDGPSQTQNTTLMVPPPPGFRPTDVAVSGACSSLPCTLGALAPGNTREVIATLSPPSGYAGPATVVVRAMVGGDPFDPRPENNTASVVTTVTQLADLSIVKTGPATAAPGAQVTYAVTVANAGPSAATGVRIDDPTPPGLTLVSASGDCAMGFPCDLGTLAAGATRTIDATYTVAGGTAAPPVVTNVATVASGTSDPNPVNNSATISTTIRLSATCDVNGDGLNDIVTGAGPGGNPHVLVWSLAGGTATALASFYAFDPQFEGDVFVACGDVNGDGQADVIAGSGQGGPPQVRAFSIEPGFVVVEIANFLAYDPGFTGGVRVAAGDVDGDGLADIITGAGPGGEPYVRAFSLAGGVTEIAGFDAYAPAFTGGVLVASGNVAGDGRAEIVTGATNSAGPVRVFEVGQAVSEVTSFYPYFFMFRGPVRVGAADVNGDGFADIITGTGPGGGPHVQAFSVSNGALVNLASFYAYDSSWCDVGTSVNPVDCDGVYVGGADVTGDGLAEIITGTNRQGGPLRVFQIDANRIINELLAFYPYFSLFQGPVRVAP